MPGLPVRTWDIEATPHIYLVLELAGLDARELGDAERGRKGIRGARRRRRLPLGCRHRVPERLCVTTQAPRKHVTSTQTFNLHGFAWYSNSALSFEFGQPAELKLKRTQTR